MHRPKVKMPAANADIRACGGGEDQRTEAQMDAVMTAPLDSMEIIAEGVEEMAQREKLRELGCIYAQGYLFGRPVPIEAWKAD